MGSRFTDDDKTFYEKLKRVGIRLTFRVPPAIEFYTIPRIYFEFSTREELWEIVKRIEQLGWRIGDGE